MGNVVINTLNINEVRNLVDKCSLGKTLEKTKKIIVIAKDDEFNRKVLENKKVDVLVFSEFSEKKDKLKQRNSGLNQVLCKFARDNKIEIGIDISMMEKMSAKELSEHISRIRQNVKLCNKYKIKMILINVKEKNKHDLIAFCLSIGMSTSMAKYAVENNLFKKD